MRIGVISDLHNDKFEHRFFNNEDNDDVFTSDYSLMHHKDILKDIDVLAIAGDISFDGRSNFQKWIDFYQDQLFLITKRHVPIIAPFGNHDYYEQSEFFLNQLLGTKEETPKKPYVHQKILIVDDCVFFSCTLWSPILNDECYKYIQDYRYIPFLSPRFGGYKKNIDKLYKSDKEWLLSNVEKQYKIFGDSKKYICVTHHAPIKELIPNKYKNDPINSAFTNLIDDDNKAYLDLPISLWIYGHIHDKNDIVVKNTRFVANPRGHSHELETYSHFKPIIVEV